MTLMFNKWLKHFLRKEKNMERHKTKVTGFRINDETILKKLSIIAEENLRTRNKEVEYALKDYIKRWEKENRIIELNKDK